MISYRSRKAARAGRTALVLAAHPVVGRGVRPATRFADTANYSAPPPRGTNSV